MKFLLASIIFVISLTNLNAQIDELRSYSNQQGRYVHGVDIHKGTGSINVPLYTIQNSKTTVPIGLSYNSSGIRVDQIASSVGLGWILNTGGSITRELRSYPDETVSIHSANQIVTVGNGVFIQIPLMGGHMFHQLRTNEEVYTITDFLSYPIPDLDLNPIGVLDTEPDIFHFNVGGYSGKFVLGYNAQPILLNQNADLKISYLTNVEVETNPTGFLKYDHPNLPSSYCVTNNCENFTDPNNQGEHIVQFTITTPNGIKYTFAHTEATTQFIKKENGYIGELDDCELGDDPYDMTNIEADGLEFYSKWFLSTIEKEGETITFDYDLEYLTDYKAVDEEANTGSNSTKVTYSYNITESRRIKSITWSTGKMEFIADANIRGDIYYGSSDLNFLATNDIAKARVIKEIKVFAKNNTTYNLINQYSLAYAANGFPSISTSCNGSYWDAHKFRPQLTTVTPKGTNANETITLPSYNFHYESTALPPRHSVNKDFWGYYKKHDDERLIPTIYEYSETASENYILHGRYSVFNRGGGYVNAYLGADRVPDFNDTKAGVLTKISYPSGGYTEYTYEAQEFKLFPLYNSGNNNYFGPGLRIKEIAQNDQANTTEESITKFTYAPLGSSLVSSGKITYAPQYMETSRGAFNQTTQQYDYTRKRHGGLFGDFGYVVYDRVIVEDNDRGYTENIFHIAGVQGDLTLDCGTYGCPYNEQIAENQENGSVYINNTFDNYPYAPHPNYEWRSGWLKEQHIYTKQNVLKQSTFNNFEIAHWGTIDAVRLKPTGIAKYQLVYGWNQLKDTRTKIYSETVAGNIETLTEYKYDNYHTKPIEIKTTNSDGSIYRKKFKYPFDYVSTFPSSDPMSIALTQLKEENNNNPLIETIQTREKVSGVEEVIAGQLVTLKKNTTSGNIVLDEIYRLEIQNPIPKSNFAISYTDNDFYKHTNYVRQGRADLYDEKDNLLEAHKEHDISNAILWAGSNKTKVIAQAQNANNEQLGFNSFEDNYITDNWDLVSYNITNTGKVGKKALQLSTEFGFGGYFNLGSEGQNKEYSFSAWVKTSSQSFLVLTTRKQSTPGIFPSPSIAPSYKQVAIPNTNGKWQYVEVKIDLADIQPYAGGNLLGIYAYLWNLGQQQITLDAVRFQPTDAMMTTMVYDEYTHLPIASAGADEIWAAIEYDALGRTKLVKDQDNNILAHQEYHYKDPNNANDLNSVKSTQINKYGIQNTAAIAPLQRLTGDIQQSITYMDGLMRPIQKVALEATSTSSIIKDLVQPIEYNDGLVERSYLAFAAPIGSGTNSGDYRSNAISTQSSFYYNTLLSGSYSSSKPYQVYQYDQSPLAKVNQLSPAHTTNSISTYLATNLSNEVRQFASDATSTGFYPANSLYKIESKDENGNHTWLFKDKIGRTLLKKQEIANNDYAETYYIYNNMELLTFIITPKETAYLQNNSWSFSPTTALHVFQYDKEQRLVSKSAPGEDEHRYIYDRLDRIVLENHDGSNIQRYLFTKYDKLSRPILSGVYYHVGIGFPVISNSSTLYENRINGGLFGYTNNAFPIINTGDEDHIHSINYYDDYDLDRDGLNDSNWSLSTTGITGSFVQGAYSGNPDARTLTSLPKGYLTQTRHRILDEDIWTTGKWVDEWRNSQYFYNKYGELIQLQEESTLQNLEDQLDFLYTFDGNLLEKLHQHHSGYTLPNGTNDMKILERYSYDHLNRLLDISHKVDANQEIILAKYNYDFLGNLAQKELYKGSIFATNPFAWQTVDYSYNARGRMTNISSDLYSEAITYQANGNISQIIHDLPITATGVGNVPAWSSQTMTDLQLIQNFGYDKMNRLLVASGTQQARTSSSSPWQSQSTHRVDNISYDKNGNILTLNRLGYNTDNNSFGSIDQLTYHYNNHHLVAVEDGIDDNDGFTEFANASGVFNSSNSSTYDYSYDAMGRLMTDKNKGISQIQYNYLGQPHIVSNATGAIYFYQDATGSKLRKTLNLSSGQTIHKDYWGIFEYHDGTLESIQHAEGRLTPTTGGNFQYEYALTDHLGSTRVTFTDGNNDNSISTTEVLQQNHQYPFGMKMKGIDDINLGVNNFYQYTGQELNEDLGLNLYDYNARFYDPAVGRFTSQDPLNSQYASWSPYTYVLNSPLNYIDPTGMNQEPFNFAGLSSSFNSSMFNLNTSFGSFWGGFSGGSPYTGGPGPYQSMDNNMQWTASKYNGYLSDYGGVIFHENGEEAWAFFGGDWQRIPTVTARRGKYGRNLMSKLGRAVYDFRHEGLDAVGSITFFGEVADGLNGFLYLLEGNRGNAGISFASMFIFGEVLKAGKYADEVTEAAHRLGFFTEDVIVKNGVADIPIIYMTAFKRSDITKVADAMKANGVESIMINSGPIINNRIATKIQKAFDQGKSFLGFKIKKTGDPTNMFILTKDL